MQNFRKLACFHYLNWNPARGDLRSFSLAMLIGFALLGLLAAWRQGGVAGLPAGLWTAGAVLAVAGRIRGLGRIAYLAVYIPTSILGHVLSQVILALMFLLVFVPIGLVLRLAGKDLLRLRAAPAWIRMGQARSGSYYNQF